MFKGSSKNDNKIIMYDIGIGTDFLMTFITFLNNLLVKVFHNSILYQNIEFTMGKKVMDN